MNITDSTHIKLTIGLFISLVCSLVVASWVVSREFSDIKYKIETNHLDVEEVSEMLAVHSGDIEEVETEVDNINIKQAEINTKLANIEAGILEIKSILKE